MGEVEAIEFAFELADLGNVSVHLLVAHVPVLVDLVNDKSRIAEYVKVFNAELDHYA
jgi:hypothetical protein